VYPTVLLKHFISIDVNRFLFFFLRDKISFLCRKIGRGSALYNFILEHFWTKVGLNAAEHACPEAKIWQLHHWPTFPEELSITIKLQCEDNRTANLMTNQGKKTFKRKEKKQLYN
jgi:hypothetical protein